MVSYDDEAPFPEPFGPEYVAPAPAACPHCPCCSARLCETGDCLTMAAAADKEIVKDCPCDAARLAIVAARAQALILARAGGER